MEELRTLEAFQSVPAEELAWLVANSEIQQLERGDYFFQEGGPAEKFYVVLDGELQIVRTVNGQKHVMGTTPAGIIGGEWSLLTLQVSFVTAQAIKPTRLRVFSQQKFREIFAACPNFGAYIFRIASERAQGYASYIQQQEKLAALGKLSAGLAHELNNPAAAARRASKTLADRLPSLQRRTIDLCGLGLSETQLQTLSNFQQTAIERAAGAPTLSTLEQSDREDEIGDWLAEHDIEDAWDVASTLVTAGIEPHELVAVAEVMPTPCVKPIIAWLHEALMTTSLLDEIEQSSSRISELVLAIKEYTYMDRALVQEVDLNRGLDLTVKMLNHKLKNVLIKRDYDPSLPLILGKGGELNQVWTNLIDNAVDAMQGEGELKLITRCENSYVMVEVTDNGPGIPPEVESRLFEPFFTTKEVGAGTGLGLDIAYRIIKQHHGTIEVWSKPGETRFIVRLPIKTE
jgi:signal transduction histidine kinase